MSPIGQKLQIGGKGFEVIGVYAGKYDGKLNTDDQMIVMPYTLQSTMMSVYGMADRQYIVKAAEKDVIAELTDELLPGFMQGRCEAVNSGRSRASPPTTCLRCSAAVSPESRCSSAVSAL